MEASRGAPGLYAITARSLVPDLLPAVEAALGAGLRWLQVREKDLAPRDLLELVRAVLEPARACGARVLVNDRADVAQAAGADGVQLGEASLPVGAVRTTFPSLLVGASVHSLAAARRAEDEGADFLLFGPVFATPAKARYGPPQGIATLAAVARTIRVPVVAVGGIGPGEVAACRRAGAAGVAAIRGLLGAPGVPGAVRAYLAALAGG